MIGIEINGRFIPLDKSNDRVKFHTGKHRHFEVVFDGKALEVRRSWGPIVIEPHVSNQVFIKAKDD